MRAAPKWGVVGNVAAPIQPPEAIRSSGVNNAAGVALAEVYEAPLEMPL